MFEISVACKYLLPRRRQLSVSIISIISTLVISLVVWLIVVFFSVTDGLEKSWINKLTALTAPVRITPNESYYKSYYYQIDTISDASGYSPKTIREKLEAEATNPYDASIDEEIPTFWPPLEQDAQGKPKDLVKLVYSSIQDIKGITNVKAHDFELTGSQIHINLLRSIPTARRSMYAGSTQTALSYPAYLGNFESDNATLSKALLPISLKDVNNLLDLTGISANTSDEEENKKNYFPVAIFQARLQSFFKQVHVTNLKTRSYGWTIPQNLLPTQFNWVVCALFKDQFLLKIVVPQQDQNLLALQTQLKEEPNNTVVTGTIRMEGAHAVFETAAQAPLAISAQVPIVLAGDSEFPAHVNEDSLQKARKIEDLKFNIDLNIQDTTLQGTVPYRGLEIGKAEFSQAFSSDAASFPLWIHTLATENQDPQYILPKDPNIGEGVLLPKGFREAGVLVGDRGYLTYYTPTTSMLQEQRLPVYVTGFYDPGIIPMGAKFILANRDIISIIRSAHNQDDRIVTNGINVRFNDYKRADEVKAQLMQSFKDKGIGRYWNIETYREFEFTKEIMRELQSQKHIFTVIAVAIIIVACSNIISMLIILVNDKKLEIGILRSMGATSKSIALIFGLAGGLIGIMGSLIGIGAAILTLKNLQSIVDFVSRIQGYDLFNSAFYGENIPQELSYEALSFVLVATIIISLLAGIVPAVKACLLKPSSILRSTG